MINGYVTYEELQIVTGLDPRILDNLLKLGMKQHVLDVDIQEDNKCYKKPLREHVFNLDEVEKWIRIHIY